MKITNCPHCNAAIGLVFQYEILQGYKRCDRCGREFDLRRKQKRGIFEALGLKPATRGVGTVSPDTVRFRSYSSLSAPRMGIWPWVGPAYQSGNGMSAGTAPRSRPGDWSQADAMRAETGEVVCGYSDAGREREVFITLDDQPWRNIPEEVRIGQLLQRARREGMVLGLARGGRRAFLRRVRAKYGEQAAREVGDVIEEALQPPPSSVEPLESGFDLELDSYSPFNPSEAPSLAFEPDLGPMGAPAMAFQPAMDPFAAPAVALQVGANPFVAPALDPAPGQEPFRIPQTSFEPGADPFTFRQVDPPTRPAWLDPSMITPMAEPDMGVPFEATPAPSQNGDAPPGADLISEENPLEALRAAFMPKRTISAPRSAQRKPRQEPLEPIGVEDVLFKTVKVGGVWKLFAVRRDGEPTSGDPAQQLWKQLQSAAVDGLVLDIHKGDREAFLERVQAAFGEGVTMYAERAVEKAAASKPRPLERIDVGDRSFYAPKGLADLVSLVQEAWEGNLGGILTRWAYRYAIPNQERIVRVGIGLTLAGVYAGGIVMVALTAGSLVRGILGLH